MRLCIPVSEPDGRDLPIAPDLRHAEHPIFFDTETRSYDAISLRELQAGANASLQTDAVLCTTINRASLQSLIEHGVMVHGTEARTVAEAVARYEDGDLVPAVAKTCGCGGHGHPHGHVGGCCSDNDARGNRHAAPAGEAHPLNSVNVLIASGMGAGLQQRLLKRGVEAVVTTEAAPEHAVAAYLAGEIQADPGAQRRC